MRFVDWPMASYFAEGFSEALAVSDNMRVTDQFPQSIYVRFFVVVLNHGLVWRTASAHLYAPVGGHVAVVFFCLERETPKPRFVRSCFLIARNGESSKTVERAALPPLRRAPKRQPPNDPAQTKKSTGT